MIATPALRHFGVTNNSATTTRSGSVWFRPSSRFSSNTRIKNEWPPPCRPRRSRSCPEGIRIVRCTAHCDSDTADSHDLLAVLFRGQKVSIPADPPELLPLLAQWRWQVQSRNQMNIFAAQGVAVREFPKTTVGRRSEPDCFRSCPRVIACHLTLTYSEDCTDDPSIGNPRDGPHPSTTSRASAARIPIARSTADGRIGCLLRSFAHACKRCRGGTAGEAPTDGAAQLENHHRFIASDHEGTDRSHVGFLCLNSFTPASET